MMFYSYHTGLPLHIYYHFFCCGPWYKWLAQMSTRRIFQISLQDCSPLKNKYITVNLGPQQYFWQTHKWNHNESMLQSISQAVMQKSLIYLKLCLLTIFWLSKVKEIPFRVRAASGHRLQLQSPAVQYWKYTIYRSYNGLSL